MGIHSLQFLPIQPGRQLQKETLFDIEFNFNFIFGGFQLEFVSISRIINSVLSLVEITAFRLERKFVKYFFKINFPPMRALESITAPWVFRVLK